MQHSNENGHSVDESHKEKLNKRKPDTKTDAVAFHASSSTTGTGSQDHGQSDELGA